MDLTQHDLSHNEVKLDYQALVKTAEIAVGRAKQELNRYSGKIDEAIGAYDKMFDGVSLRLNAQLLLNEAEYLCIACETLSALKGGLDREDVIIINKPEINVASEV